MIKALSLDQLRMLLPVTTMKVYEPHSEEEVGYSGIKFNDVLSLPGVYGDSWSKEEEVLFTCEDGYRPSIPVSEFRTYISYLAFKMENGKPFVVRNKGQNEKDVPLGPFYLIWDNKKNPELGKEGASYWPYQIISVDLVKFSDKFSQLAPPPGSSAKIVEGFVAFRKHCLKCHTISGEGGNKGPELLGITNNYSKEWLQKFIAHPRRVRPESHMLELNLKLPDREMVISRIIGYLDAKTKERKK